MKYYCIVNDRNIISYGHTDKSIVEDYERKFTENCEIIECEKIPLETVVREWVAVTDRLPKKMDNYRVFVSNKTLSYQRDAIYSKEHGGWVISDYGLGVLKDVTHWMELPSNPSA